MKHASVISLNVLLSHAAEQIPVGKLALKDRRIWFQYDAGFLGKRLELSPFKLPLKPDVVPCEDRVFEGMFGLFNDSLPDGWGRLLLDRHMRALGIAPETMTVLDRLAYVGKRGMGALLYEPDYAAEGHTENALDLNRLAQDALVVLDGSTNEVIDELLSLNGSSAGARPKIMTGVSKDKKRITHGVGDLADGYEHWLIKFSSRNDMPDCGAVEYAYSLMAKKAGIDIPETFLFPAAEGAGYFGVRRFDRRGNTRVHVHTVSGLLHADHRMPSLDYEAILKTALALTKSVPEAEALFRLAAFNVFAYNRDDHAKNFSFLMDTTGAWQAAPAYDLTFSSGPGGEHSTTVLASAAAGGEDRFEKTTAYNRRSARRRTELEKGCGGCRREQAVCGYYLGCDPQDLKNCALCKQKQCFTAFLYYRPAHLLYN